MPRSKRISPSGRKTREGDVVPRRRGARLALFAGLGASVALIVLLIIVAVGLPH